MNKYIPDNWVVVELPNNTGHKILAGWSGGYLYGDSWRLNSGVERYEDCGDHVLFHGYSGSVYKCRKSSEMLLMNCANIASVLEDAGAKIVTYEDFMKGKTNE